MIKVKCLPPISHYILYVLHCYEIKHVVVRQMYLLLTPWQLAASCNNILVRQLLTVGDGSIKAMLSPVYKCLSELHMNLT